MEFTPTEREKISESLSKGLGPEFLNKRPGPSGSFTYVEGWMVIDLANKMFGFDGWSSEVKSLSVDYVDELEGNRYNVAASAQIRVTLKNGTFHEDIGCGSVENMRIKSAALEKARKAAVTDGLKRALRLFGRVLGNCLYDQAFIRANNHRGTQKVNATNEVLYRHQQFQPETPAKTTIIANGRNNGSSTTTPSTVKPLATPTPMSIVSSRIVTTGTPSNPPSDTPKSVLEQPKPIVLAENEESFSYGEHWMVWLMCCSVSFV
ncbi:Rad52/22 family double-strand break repair protein-domain-containing protein [Phycomyces nitens]|nr:Rad52/22 family double-strand break repair protein-domain-containing protein [Phycomyces nitens]